MNGMATHFALLCTQKSLSSGHDDDETKMPSETDFALKAILDWIGLDGWVGNLRAGLC